jgi:pyrroloquinoline quinone (PQQ) biosynthesis protein C
MSTRDHAASTDIVPAIEAIIDDTVSQIVADPVYGRIWDGTASRELYLRFLTQTYHYVKLTQVLLAHGARALRDDPDPTRRTFGERFAHHEREEVGHEQWVLDDIRAIGGDAAAAERAEPGAAVKGYQAMVAFLWSSRHPVALMGVSTLLEGISEKLGASTTRSFLERSQIPGIENGLTFFRTHGVADVGHMEEARLALRKVADERDRQAIVSVARMTALYYAHLIHP